MLCQWDDDPADTIAHPPGAYESLLFTQGVVPTGSMREYYLEVSYGDYWIQGDVHGWFSQPTYVESNYFTNFFAAADPFIDYSAYDRDGDGFTDAVWIFHAGPGEEETHVPADIWSFAVSGLDYMTDDGVIIDRFACNPEMHADGSIISIRVACHEAGHVLGLPDLYDTDAKLDTVTYYTPGDANDHPIVDWCVMGYYGYNIMSFGTRQDPAHFCAWSKERLGFIIPTVLSTSQSNIIIPEVQTSPVVYRIDGPAQQSFLLENRNANSSAIFDHLDSDFSAYFPWFTAGQNQKDSGLLITHVDDALTNNRGIPHYRVTVEDAGYDPATPWDGISEFSDWWYPYEIRAGAPFAAEDVGQSAFTPNSTPNSNWYGSASGIWITNISESGSQMTFDLGFGNAWPAIVSHFPASLDSTYLPSSSVSFSVTGLDEDGDPTTYDWFVNGAPVQSGPLSDYLFTVGGAGAVDVLSVVASDGQLADSLDWTVRGALFTSVAGSGGAIRGLRVSASPTPFNPLVTITSELPTAGAARLSVHDVEGRVVVVLLDGEHASGVVTRTWEGRTLSGAEAASGVYWVRLEAAGAVETTKIVLLR